MSEISGERTITCNESGIHIWPGIALVQRHGGSFARVPERDISNLAGVLHGSDVIYGSLIPTLERAARLLERGQLAQRKQRSLG
jgi:hypothetical protein